MTITTTEPREISVNIFRMLEQGWNNASGAGFAEPFSDNAEFIDITGSLHPNASASYIAEAHQGLFMSIYKDSRIAYQVVQARQIDQNTILAHSTTELDAPSGPLAGKNNSAITAVLTHADGKWKILAFQNTLVMKR